MRCISASSPSDLALIIAKEVIDSLTSVKMNIVCYGAYSILRGDMNAVKIEHPWVIDIMVKEWKS